MPKTINDPYETRRPWEEWDAQRDALFDSLGFDDEWLQRETEKRAKEGVNGIPENQELG